MGKSRNGEVLSSRRKGLRPFCLSGAREAGSCGGGAGVVVARHGGWTGGCELRAYRREFSSRTSIRLASRQALQASGYRAQGPGCGSLMMDDD